MAVETSLPALLDTLTSSLTAASQSAAKLPAYSIPEHGISLLDTKNELFLSYLQNLVFLIIIKLRNRRESMGSNDDDGDDIDSSVTRKLVELSVYLERGVLNLEGKLKYQIDKVLRAAQDADVAAKIQGTAAVDRTSKEANGAEESDVDVDDVDDEDDSDVDPDEAGGVELKPADIDELQYRPNPSALMRPSFAGADTEDRKSDGVYRPPRIQATAMPTTERRDKEVRKSNKSATLDEFVSTELSSAPLPEPSIGSGIIAGGRRSKSEKERKEEKERREYEERNYVRLPKETKKERAKKGGRKDAGYGGEEWRGLGEGIDRIDRLTQRKGESRTALEKSRKRSTEDGPRGSGGAEVGQSFQKRLKALDGGRRDRGRR